MDKQPRFGNHNMNNLIKLNKNLYINPSDPLYYEKVIRYKDAQCPEAHYRIAQQHELKGAHSRALFHYKEAARSFPSPYSLKARHAIRQIEMNNQPHMPYTSGNSASRPIHASKWNKLLLASLLLSLVLAMILLGTEPIKTVVSSIMHPKISMDIVYESIDVPFLVYLPQDEPYNKVEKMLYRRALELSQTMPTQNIQLYGIFTSNLNDSDKPIPLTNDKLKENAAVLAEYNASVDPAVRIRFVHPEYQQEQLSSLPLMIIGTNLVRTALQTYITDKGGPPDSLEQLTGDYPNNYLSFIPNEGGSGTNRVHSTYNGQGGWVYNSTTTDIAEMLFPNSTYQEGSIPFQPVEIVISKKDHRLQVISGKQAIQTMRVGLGKNGSTPEGTFIINERVLEAKAKRANAYGEAGLGMGDIAIHGTYDNNSIGNNQSMGCIRLSNKDIQELFPFAAKGMVVKIEGETAAARQTDTVTNLSLLIPANLSQSNQTSTTVFNWLG